MPKGRILIVEENFVVRKMLYLTLLGEDFIIQQAKTGGEALRLIRKEAFNLIITDLVLPDMSGIQLAQTIRKVLETNNIPPIIALSGFLNKLDEHEANNAGFATLLLKPIEPSYLLEVVKSLLPGEVEISKDDRNKNILIVDDDAAQLKLLGIRLKQAGFSITTAADGLDAFRQALSIHPDAIISDILMPHLDGFELCLRIRQHPELAKTPVILMSSQYLEEADQALAKKVGANAFLTRTFDFKDLIPTLIENLDQPKVPEVTSVPTQLFNEEHLHSLIRQLERQVTNSAILTKRCALQGAQLSLLREVANSITNEKQDLNDIIKNILAISLDAAGITTGILFLLDTNGRLQLSEYLGYGDNKKSILERFSKLSIFNEILNQKEIIVINKDSRSHEEEMLMQKANVDFALLVPLHSFSTKVGVLFLGSNTPEISQQSAISFANALGMQIGQTIELALSYNKLAISEKWYKTLMDNASCGFITCDKVGTIIDLNKQVEQLFGFSKKEILGISYFEFIVPIDRIFSMKMIEAALTDKPSSLVETRVRQNDGTIRDVEVSMVVINVDEKPLLLITLNDVTERNKLRAQTLLNDRLATVGTLATGIVHEISNPTTWTLENLQELKFYTEALQSGIDQIDKKNDSNEDEKKTLQDQLNTQKAQLKKMNEMIVEALEGAQQVRDIVRNLKGFARIDSNIDVGLSDVHDVINAAIKMAHPEFKYRAKLEKDFDESIPPLELNTGKLHQVFLNLLINAAQAIAENNRKDNLIKITTRRLSNYVRIDISDTGIGIPEELKHRIFEPFFTTKPTGIGTGLGLPICAEIVKNMGGVIDLESELYQGTTFTVKLPLHTTAKKKEPKKQKAKRKEGVNILIIDDEPSLLKSLQRMLEVKHKVTAVLGGQAALEILEKKATSFDVYITDLQMPNVSGMDIHQFLKKQKQGLERHVIFMSGEVEASENVKKFFDEHPNICVRKPFTREELLKSIDSLMEIIEK